MPAGAQLSEVCEPDTCSRPGQINESLSWESNAAMLPQMTLNRLAMLIFADSSPDAHDAVFKARPCNPPEARNGSKPGLDERQTADDEYGLADGWNDACGIASRYE